MRFVDILAKCVKHRLRQHAHIGAVEGVSLSQSFVVVGCVQFLVNPSLGNGTIWDQSKVRSYTDPVEAANPMGPGDDGLALLLQTVVCGNEESPQLLTALYQAVVGDDLVVQCELMVY